jgi:hypothetical protein
MLADASYCLRSRAAASSRLARRVGAYAAKSDATINKTAASAAVRLSGCMIHDISAN